MLLKINGVVTIFLNNYLFKHEKLLQFLLGVLTIGINYGCLM